MPAGACRQAKNVQPGHARRLAIAAALAFAAIASPFSASAQAIAHETGTDNPHRIITLTPHATEIVFAAGGGEHIVGTVTSSDFPTAARALPRIGDGITMNQERIIMLRPTLLIGWLRSGAALQLESLAEQLGAGMMYSQPQRLRDIPADLRRVGQRLDTAATAQAAADALDERITTLESRYATRPPVSVFIEVGDKPLYTIGSDPLLNDALRTCGAVNVYADTGIPAPRVPVESVLVQNPQLIVATERPGADAAALEKRWSAYGLPAARQGHVHIADPDALFRPGPRLIDAAEALCVEVESVRQAQARPRHTGH